MKRNSPASLRNLACAILSSECTIVSTVELVWKAMELLQLDEDRMLRVELSLQEVLLNGHLQPGE